jgi:hypothetical protein
VLLRGELFLPSFYAVEVAFGLVSCLIARNYHQRSAVCGVGAESRWRVFLHSWCDTGLCGYYFILALAKTVTPGGSPRQEPGRPVPPLTVFHFDQNILAAQKPMTYTDLLPAGLFSA